MRNLNILLQMPGNPKILCFGIINSQTSRAWQSKIIRGFDKFSPRLLSPGVNKKMKFIMDDRLTKRLGIGSLMWLAGTITGARTQRCIIIVAQESKSRKNFGFNRALFCYEKDGMCLVTLAQPHALDKE